MILEILTFILLATGIFTVFSAGKIVEHYNLDKKVKSDFEYEMQEEELNSYRHNSAVVNVKILGMLIALPGFILIFIVFR